MKKNNIKYRFSEEEVEAVGTLIRWAQEYKKSEASPIVKKVASAFNRDFFKMIGREKSDCQKSEKCAIISKNNNMQMKKKQITREDIEKASKRVVKYQKENNALLKKHKLNSRVVISWPNRQKPPRLGKFAMWLLNKTSAIVDTEYKII